MIGSFVKHSFAGAAGSAPELATTLIEDISVEVDTVGVVAVAVQIDDDPLTMSVEVE